MFRLRNLIFTQTKQLTNCLLLAGSLLCLGLPDSSAALPQQTALTRSQGQPLYPLTLEVMTRLRQQQDKQITETAVLEELLTQRHLLAKNAARFDKYDVYAGARRVGFDPAVASDDQLAAALRSVYQTQIEASLKALPGGSLQGKVSAEASLTANDWQQLLGPAGQLIAEYRFNDKQLAQAKQWVLLRSPLAPDGVITLADVHARQNVQGRVAIFNRDNHFVRQQAWLMLGQLYVRQWAEQQFGQAAVNDLREALRTQSKVQAVMALHGIGADIDSESLVLNQLAKQVSQREIQAYYREHKAEFRRIAWITARHIRVPDQATADKVLQAARSGQDFATLARRYSIAPDAVSGGDLGKILHEGKLSWLQELAMMQEPGVVSPPFRAAVAANEHAYYEILLVSQREYAYQPENSETVRYQASRAIAQQKAVQQMQRMQQEARLAAQHDIRHNGDKT